ncbi:probable dioxygenase [hydrothermal vent metagenome]|uniref:Probable dioxygenase n=1 Tax=hydrothermal vent metagenome TaxID=652676 RepID=A0A3B1CZB6_9ZZZZ
MNVLFHLAFPVHDLEAAKQFYVRGLGCHLGRTSASAMTLDLAGHQIIAHLDPGSPKGQQGVYPRHFGLVFLSRSDWEELARRAEENGLNFYQKPRRRFPDTPLEHETFFLEDPSRNLLEFKHYTFESAIFGEQQFSEVGD